MAKKRHSFFVFKLPVYFQKSFFFRSSCSKTVAFNPLFFHHFNFVGKVGTAESFLKSISRSTINHREVEEFLGFGLKFDPVRADFMFGGTRCCAKGYF